MSFISVRGVKKRRILVAQIERLFNGLGETGLQFHEALSWALPGSIYIRLDFGALCWPRKARSPDPKRNPGGLEAALHRGRIRRVRPAGYYSQAIAEEAELRIRWLMMTGMER